MIMNQQFAFSEDDWDELAGVDFDLDVADDLSDLDVFTREFAAISEVPGAFLAYVTTQRAVCA